MRFQPSPLSWRERFDSRTQAMPSGCIEWQGSYFNSGYGRFTKPDSRASGLAHRLIYAHVHGPIPDGMYVCHRCDNPRCVNVEHLFLGSPEVNVQDAKQKGRRAPNPSPMRGRTHCKRGHEFTPENTIRTKGGRNCRECQRMHDRASYARKTGREG